MNTTLREAMGRVDIFEADEANTLQHVDMMEAELKQLVTITNDEAAQVRKKKEEEAAEHQRQLDAALADAIEIVARHRTRLGRRVCSRPDGAAIRQMFELLKGMSSEIGADSDPAFGNNHSNYDT
jgi:hypothetical protein